MHTLEKLEKKERSIFFQSKFNYYKKFNTWVIIISSLTSLTYFFSDCQLFSRIAWETLLPRTFILLPLSVFLIINSRVKTYKIMVPLSYAVGHCIMWCTIWAIYHLPIRQHASEGFLIMQIMFFAIGYSAPFYMSSIFHTFLLINIVVSNLFINYENFDLMLSLGIPVFLAICTVNYIMGNIYLDHYCLKKKLEESLMLDPLTKIYNRNKLNDIVVKNTTRFNFNSCVDISVLIVDIDHFKNINDTFGHDEGDRVIINTANIIRSCIRAIDVVIRWGGEEFIVIMPGCSSENAVEKAEQIRKVINNSNDICDITVSIGVGKYDGENYYKSITDADKSLYYAKANGRNQVVFMDNISQTLT